MTDVTATATPISWRDYYELTKPRVVMLMLITAAVGSFLATPGIPPLDVMFAALVGIALMGGSAAVINHVADSHVDARMARTMNRPVATGRVSPMRAIAFSAAIGIAGMVVLLAFVNPITAWLNLASWFGYGLFYTLYLKRATPQNIVIGGIFGAAPPLFGWTAVTGTIDPGGILLVLIIFIWTPPHFWALAIDRREDYARTDVPMLPITHGIAYTRLHILLYTVLLAAVTLLPFTIGMLGPIYLAGALALNAVFLYWAVRLWLDRDPKDAINTFKYSILYLALLFPLMLVDHYLVASAVVSAPESALEFQRLNSI